MCLTVIILKLSKLVKREADFVLQNIGPQTYKGCKNGTNHILDGATCCLWVVLPFGKEKSEGAALRVTSEDPMSNLTAWSQESKAEIE